jgi:hypothetical protein
VTTRKRHEQLWHDTGTGLVIPSGISSDLSFSSSKTYLEIKEKAKAIEQLYADNHLPIPSTSDLARLIEDAKRLSDSWLTNRITETPISLLFRVGHLDRVADAILPLAGVCERIKYMTSLASGSLDLLQRDRSAAKDILWEVELWSILRRRRFDAVLHEPPDIVVEFENATVGIACKKLPSGSDQANSLILRGKLTKKGGF